LGRSRAKVKDFAVLPIRTIAVLPHPIQPNKVAAAGWDRLEAPLDSRATLTHSLNAIRQSPHSLPQEQPHEPSQNENVNVSDAWLDETVQKAKEKYQFQRALDERLAQEKTLKCKLGAQFCNRLFEWLGAVETRFNDRFGGHVLTVRVVRADGNHKVEVLAQPVHKQERIAEVTYEDNTTSLTLRTLSIRKEEGINLVLSSAGTMLAELGAVQYSHEQLGQKIISDLLA
jgi:hypothetical protein